MCVCVYKSLKSLINSIFDIDSWSMSELKILHTVHVYSG